MFLFYLKAEKLKRSLEADNGDQYHERRPTAHSLVTTFRRGKDPIRNEIVISSNNFLKVSFKSHFK